MGTQITAKIIGLKEDLEKERQDINKQADKALFSVGVEMKRDLQVILQKEWYERYTPTTYERRTDDNSLGRPIGSDDNFDVSVKRQSLEFSFNPTGKHANPEWSVRNGDALIEWIQAEHNYAESDDGEIIKKIPSRPFWNKFLDEQMDGGIMEKFANAMLPKYSVITDKSDDLSELAYNYLPEDVKVHKL